MKKIVSGLVLFSLFAGCSPAKDSTPSVFVYEGGRYTEAQLKADVNLREFLTREIIRVRKGNLELFEKEIGKQRLSWRDEIIAQNVLMISAQLEAAREGIAADSELRSRVERKYESSIGGGYASLRAKATKAGLKDAFDRQFERDLSFAAVRDSVLKTGAGFSETNVWYFLTNATNAMHWAEERNCELYLEATNAVKCLRAGEDFYSVYDVCCNLESGEKEATRKPGEYDDSDFPPEDPLKTWEILKALPAGSVSEVFDTDEGLVIYKVFEHIEKSAQTGQFALKLGKIVIRRVVVQEIPKPDVARKMVKETLEKEAIEQKMKKAVKAAKIEFGPAAGNLSPRLRQQLEEIGVLMKKDGDK